MIAEHVIAVLDWFLMEGGEPSYEAPPTTDGGVTLDDGIFEIRFPEFEVYVGPSTKPIVSVMDVSALLRPAMALDSEVIQAWLEPHVESLPPGFELEVLPTEDGHANNSLWLTARLSMSDFQNHFYPEILALLMTEARRLHSLSY